MNELLFCILFLLSITINPINAIEKTVYVETPGSLLTLVEDDVENITSLILKGKIDKTDFIILRNMVNNGKLESINLLEVDNSLNDNLIPKQAFQECENLKHIVLPESLVGIASEAFRKCINLKDIIIPSTTSGIDIFAFAGCSGLTEIEFPESMKLINSYAFFDCINLEYVDFPKNGIYICSEAFLNCIKIKEITIYSDSEIEGRAFGQTSLEKIICATEIPPILRIDTFTESQKEDVIVYVPKGSLHLYKWTTPYWSEFKNVVEEDVPLSIEEKFIDKTYSIIKTNEGVQIETSIFSSFYIFDMDGKLIKKIQGIGTLSVNLEEGVYIVSSKEGNTKIIL